MVFMLYALTRTFKAFRLESLLPDLGRLTAATAIVLAAGALASWIPPPAIANARWLAVFELGKVLLGCGLAAWPALAITRSVTGAESQALLALILPKPMRVAAKASSAV
jgi:hypothetical protein